MALKEVIEVVGLPLTAMVIAKPGHDEVMLVRSGSVSADAVRYCNRMLAQTRAMVAAGRWS